jgi:hypothetical protein
LVLVYAAVARNSWVCYRGLCSGRSGWRVKEERRDWGAKKLTVALAQSAATTIFLTGQSATVT